MYRSYPVSVADKVFMSVSVTFGYINGLNMKFELIASP